jgi:UDP-3-O-[3-hydroxymyristoyl] N-acetylglucosamine deacetylase
MESQLTVAQEIRLSGVGIHSGKAVNLRILPSADGEVLFRRVDLEGLEFRIDPALMTARNSSNLIQGEHSILTIEHLMAALAAFSIHSVVVELDGEEIPVMDGSALPFVQALEHAGIKRLDRPRQVIRIQKPFKIEEGRAELHVEPADEWLLSYRIEYDHPQIGVQEFSLSLEPQSFASQIAPARTFGFLKDVPDLRARKLALGGSFENALVLDETSLLNGPLRFPDEFVRHKVLDLIGDLALLGRPLRGRFAAVRAGHQLHLRLTRFLLENPSYWTDA